MMTRLVSCFLGLLITQAAASQTKNVDITAVIQNHFAETTISSDIVNDANTSAEVGFQVMLPKEAFITHFEMVIDGTTYEGVIKEKGKAKKLYTEAKKRGKTTGLVEAREEADKIFKTSVNVEAGTLVQFKLTYQQLLRKVRGKYANKIILFGDQLSGPLSMNVYICESRALKNVTVPPILGTGGTSIEPTVAINVDGNFAHVEFSKDDSAVSESLGSGGAGFIVEYQLGASPGAADVVVDDGYFIYFGPDIDFIPRRIIFVLDVSGSMGGFKLQQLKEAMHNILNKMTVSDRFDIMKFSSSQRNWRGELNPGTAENIQSARNFIDGYDEFGGTQIWDALKRALVIMHEDTADDEPISSGDYILLLTDGQGALSPEFVLSALKDYNTKRFAIHTISFGTGANNDFLKSIAAQNSGRWKQILVDLDSALQIENFVDELGMSTPLPLVIGYPEVVDESLSVKSKYGGELMSVGKFGEIADPRKRGPYEIAITGFSNTNETVYTSFQLDQSTAQCGGMGGKKIQQFAKKAFGMVKVENALQEMDLTTDPTEKALLEEKAVNMSLLYDLVTPVTSIIVIKPEDEADINKDLEKEEKTETTATKSAPTTTTTRSPPRALGRAGLPSSPPRWSLHSDPHFVAKLSDDITVCFNWVGRNGEVVNLFSDSIHSVFINALIEGDSNEVEGQKDFTKRLFVTKVAVLLPGKGLVMLIDSESLTISDASGGMEGQTVAVMPLRTVFHYNLKLADIEITILEVTVEHTILTVKISRDISVVVEVHHWTPKNNKSRDHLDLAMPTYDGDSTTSGGLLGHLQGRTLFNGGDPRITLDSKRNATYLEFNNGKVPVIRRRMRVPYLKSEVDCWMSRGHFQHLLGSRLRHFKLSSLMEFPGIL